MLRRTIKIKCLLEMGSRNTVFMTLQGQTKGGGVGRVREVERIPSFGPEVLDLIFYLVLVKGKIYEFSKSNCKF